MGVGMMGVWVVGCGGLEKGRKKEQMNERGFSWMVDY